MYHLQQVQHLYCAKPGPEEQSPRPTWKCHYSPSETPSAEKTNTWDCALSNTYVSTVQENIPADVSVTARISLTRVWVSPAQLTLPATASVKNRRVSIHWSNSATSCSLLQHHVASSADFSKSPEIATHRGITRICQKKYQNYTERFSVDTKV